MFLTPHLYPSHIVVQALTYGAVVELKHVKSGRLLSVAAPDESSRSINRELMLSLYTGEGTW